MTPCDRNCKSCTWTAAAYGHVDCLKQAHSDGCPMDFSTTLMATKYGNLQCLQYARSHGCPWDVKAILMLAASKGYLELLNYVLETASIHPNWSSKVTEYAARSGDVECLKIAHLRGCKWSSMVTYAAAENGHMECLRYAAEKGCRLHPAISRCAAQHGHLDCLKYVMMNGCEWDKNLTYIAARGAKWDCLDWCLDNGCPTSKKPMKTAWMITHQSIPSTAHISKTLLWYHHLRPLCGKALMPEHFDREVDQKYIERQLSTILLLLRRLPTDIFSQILDVLVSDECGYVMRSRANDLHLYTLR